ncbi:Site-specific recombinase XerD [Pricia antarctica]|uniref:Site-specific recombinase XerD n=1 Tax=Pricia antarctica TaxID=641691 RepID=A0A1G7HHH3_9FLAO|nr:site-specific integrase [Pricia antarctica]SDE99763.1 Site-specific recombinase XerD [Pricia antarctica]
MKTSVTLSLDKRRSQKNGDYPIVLRLTHYRKTTGISTGQSIPELFWDQNKSKVKKNYDGIKSVGNLNNFLLKELGNAQDVINRLHEKGELSYLSLVQVKDYIVGKGKYRSFFKLAADLELGLRKSNRIGTADTYKHAVAALKNFTNKRDVKINEVNYDFLKRFETFHLSKESNTLNGLASYMRTIRAIYNKGIKAKFIEKEAYPFEDYKIRTTPTAKRAIDHSYIKMILELQLEKGTWPFHYRNYFLISYMLFGMSFIDMAFLQVKNIVNGRVKFQRKKTSRGYDINLTSQLEEILKFYIDGKSKEDYILPVISEETLEGRYKQVRGARKRYNKGLNKIAEQFGLEENLTSYVSRHSFATHAMLKDVPLQAISAMLGHQKLNTTQIYLKSLPSNILDSYQEQLVIR